MGRPTVEHRGPGRIPSVAGPAVVAVFGAFLVISEPALGAVVAVVVALGVVARAPVVASIAALVVCQESASSAASEDGEGPQGGGVTVSLGHQLYDGIGTAGVAGSAPVRTVLPILVLMGVAALFAGLRLLRPPSAPALELRGTGKAALAVILALCGCAVASGVVASGSLLAAVNQEARPFVLLAMGFVVGVAAHVRSSGAGATGVVTALALLGLAAVAVGEVLDGVAGLDPATTIPAFYDAALPAVAAAVLLALVFDRQDMAPAIRAAICVAAVVVLLLGLRRNVWLGGGVALVLCLAAGLGRGRATTRLLGGVAVLAPVALLLPGVVAAVADRVTSSLSALGPDADVALQGHVTDLEIAWRYVVQSPVTGIGSRHGPLPGLVVQDPGVVYLHNEYLLDWLRFGLPGVVLVTALLGILVVQAIAVLRSRRCPTRLELTAAMFVILVPVCCLTAPFVSTTARWPALLGIAAGVLAVRPGSTASDPVVGVDDQPSGHRVLRRSSSTSAAGSTSRHRRGAPTPRA